MKNSKVIAISMLGVMATASLGATNEELFNKINLLQKEINTIKKSVSVVKKQSNKDNIKWDVDFRTAIDNIKYTHVSGAKSSNPDLLTNRLWLGMGYAPSDNVFFKAKLSYFKSYGDTANHSQSNTNPGYADFDWITNENATNGNLKVKEAYWFYHNDTFLGSRVPWTISVGRRPSTDGLGINLREGMKANSPLSHTVNVEFDGLSSKFYLDKATGVEGMWWKWCVGRGLTNAKQRFQQDGADYASDDTQTKDNNMYGFIFVPWDNGQYSIRTNWARAEHMIGFDQMSMNMAGMTSKGYDPYSGTQQSGGMPTKYLNGSPTADNQGNPLAVVNGYDANNNYYQNNNSLIAGAMQANAPKFKDFGDIDLFTLMFKADGLGDGISDFLDDTIFFASWAQSKTNPKDNMTMLGSNDSKTGTSTWLAINMPSPLSEDARFGIEWNKGSKYWRSVTYGEDTMIGSKIAARGTAIEVYYNQPLTKSLNLNIRYTKIDYDYTGSNSFFGDDGAPITMSEAKAKAAAGQGADVVEKASDLRASISYIF